VNSNQDDFGSIRDDSKKLGYFSFNCDSTCNVEASCCE
jgi:hypothetical protein